MAAWGATFRAADRREKESVGWRDAVSNEASVSLPSLPVRPLPQAEFRVRSAGGLRACLIIMDGCKQQQVRGRGWRMGEQGTEGGFSRIASRLSGDGVRRTPLVVVGCCQIHSRVSISIHERRQPNRWAGGCWGSLLGACWGWPLHHHLDHWDRSPPGSEGTHWILGPAAWRLFTHRSLFKGGRAGCI